MIKELITCIYNSRDQSALDARECDTYIRLALTEVESVFILLPLSLLFPLKHTMERIGEEEEVIEM